MKLTRSAILPLAIFVVASGSPSHADTIGDAIDQQAKAVEAKMIAWRRDIHQNPELGNREFRTSALGSSISGSSVTKYATRSRIRVLWPSSRAASRGR